MPTIYKVRDPVGRNQLFVESRPKARKLQLQMGENATVEPLEYQYKWQITVMLNNAYDEGRDDVSSGMD
jgi:hypothetical protein